MIAARTMAAAGAWAIVLPAMLAVVGCGSIGPNSLNVDPNQINFTLNLYVTVEPNAISVSVPISMPVAIHFEANAIPIYAPISVPVNVTIDAHLLRGLAPAGGESNRAVGRQAMDANEHAGIDVLRERVRRQAGAHGYVVVEEWYGCHRLSLCSGGKEVYTVGDDDGPGQGEAWNFSDCLVWLRTGRCLP